MTENTIQRPNRTYRILVLGLMFMAGGGLDIKNLLHLSWPFSFIYLFLLFMMTARFIRVNSNELAAALMAFVSMLIAYIMKGTLIELWILAVVFQGYLVLTFYKNWPEKFAGDLSRLCQLYMYYTIVGIALQFLMGGGISSTGFYRYKHLFYLFYYTSGMEYGSLRFTGLGGEPGIWQMFLSLNLLFALYEKRSKWQLILAFVAIIGVTSTTGYFIMMFVVLFFFGVVEKKLKISHIAGLAIIGLASFGVLYEDITRKLSNSSGLTRVSDIFIGLTYLSKSPLWGIDPGTLENNTDNEFQTIKEAVAENSEAAMGDQNYFDSGLCSGIMIFLLDYGLIFASYYLYKLFKFPLFRDRHIKTGVLVIILLTFMTEPYSRSGWFYFFLLASFIRFHWTTPRFNESKNTK